MVPTKELYALEPVELLVPDAVEVEDDVPAGVASNILLF